MHKKSRPIGFWILIVFIGLSILLILVGQTMSVFDYDFTVRHGLQESAEQVSDYGVQVNRSFGAGDTVVYIPLLIASLIGLSLRKQWALITTAAVAGISLYWSATIMFMFMFLPGTQGYNYVPGIDIWFLVGIYAVFGVWSLFYVIFRGKALVQ